jgi:hypothetical protein
VFAARYDRDRDPGVRQRGGDEPADSPGPDDRDARHRESLEATGRFELPNGAFAEPCLTTWLRRLSAPNALRPKLAGSGNRTHASTLGRSQAAITSYPRARRPSRFAHPVTASYNRPTARENTIAMVTSEIIASTVINPLAQRLRGITSVGLNAVEFVNARYR